MCDLSGNEYALYDSLTHKKGVVVETTRNWIKLMLFEQM